MDSQHAVFGLYASGYSTTSSVVNRSPQDMRPETRVAPEPLRLNADANQACDYPAGVIDSCYKSRFLARALDYYCLEKDYLDTGVVYCLMANCHEFFNGDKQMLRHLKNCPYLRLGVFRCPQCADLHQFRTVSKDKRSRSQVTLYQRVQRKSLKSLSLSPRSPRSPPLTRSSIEYGEVQSRRRSGAAEEPAIVSPVHELSIDGCSSATAAFLPYESSPGGVELDAERQPLYSEGQAYFSSPPPLPELPSGQAYLVGQHLLPELPSGEAYPQGSHHIPELASGTFRAEAPCDDTSPSVMDSSTISSGSESRQGQYPPTSSYRRSQDICSPHEFPPYLRDADSGQDLWHIYHMDTFSEHFIQPVFQESPPPPYEKARPQLTIQTNSVGHLNPAYPPPSYDDDALVNTGTSWSSPSSPSPTDPMPPPGADARYPVPPVDYACSDADNQALEALGESSPEYRGDYRCPWPGCDWAPTGITKNFASYLRKHKQTHDNSRRFRCQHCHKAYKRKDNLGSHLRKTHNIHHGQRRRRRSVG
ncbi:hypothetical protein GGS23DRAFT_194947 [Durotheca rogersii]|uniref:uncharacterized protein n=1 Tax=Durotheca rogersii TaxID=419775 RepID=UPI00221E879F|nr:uncharacterized protein GGS23DRAFT_194947 [Durotheca rogersii]KAI5867780.1 hypothetical protein GGS23DRAFT_194947 [Durotheca rogersii]